MTNDADMIEMLRSARTIAVVGLSSKPMRPSYGVAAYLQRQGYRIIPVNPAETEVLGEKAYATLGEVPEKIDIVDVFRRSDAVPEAIDEAIRLGCRMCGCRKVWSTRGRRRKRARRG